MTLLLRRLCALFVMLLTLTPVLAGAVEAGKARPVAWLALRSAGFTNVRNWFGSWHEWANRDLPVAPQDR